jgi:hypothetical protein
MKSHFLSAACFMLFALLISQVSAQGVRGNGNVVTDSRSVGSFDGLIIKGACDVIISEGSSSRVRLKTDENLQEVVDIYVKEGNLIVENKESIKKSTEMTLYVSADRLSLIKVSGAANIEARDEIGGNELDIIISGAVDANLDLDVSCIHVSCSGAATLNLSGRSGCANYKIDGAATVKAYDLRTDKVKITVSGTGNAELHADENLDVAISGMASINYKGNARLTKNMRGMGSIQRQE